MQYKESDNLVFKNREFREPVKFFRCKNVLIENCTLIGSSLKFLECTNARIMKCTFTNSVRNAIQFDKCKRGQILDNKFEEPVGQSKVEDIISIYKSAGTSNSPILIRNNRLHGGGPSQSGGGIMLGDNMGNNQIAESNICINTGQYGIAIAGGENNKIINNTVTGEAFPWSNIGIYVWGIPARGSVVRNARVSGNTVSWKNRLGKRNNIWVGANTYGVIKEKNIEK